MATEHAPQGGRRRLRHSIGVITAAATLVLALAGPAAAAVVEVISQPTMSWFGSAGRIMQTFTPTQSGYITEVAIGTDVQIDPTGSLVIYAGAGPGAVLTSQSVDWQGGNGFRTVVLDTPVLVTAGSTYSLYPVGVQTRGGSSTTDDPYPGGEVWLDSGGWQSWSDCVAATNCANGWFDMAFSVTIEDVVDTDGDGVDDANDAYPFDPTRAVECPAGSYGAFDCTPAPPGTYVATPGQLTATPCPVGTYSAVAGSVACSPAPVGTFVDFVGAAQATPCPVGTFSSVVGSVACSPAPVGTFVDFVGAAQATPCPVGTFSAVVGSVACTAAPVGTYVDIIGAAEATLCPAGTSTVGIGSTSVADCLTDSDGDGTPDLTDLDDDNDTVLDDDDVCPATVLAETPPDQWKANRYVADASGVFVDPTGKEAGVTVTDTAGCSGSQIIEAAGLGGGHVRFGITRSALLDWVEAHQ